MNLDWNSIRTFKGSQSNAFEELCVQLACAETPPDARFVRKGTPDAGVECYCQLQDGCEWGWQAKYFTASPTSTQWQQLDKSVKSALDKHSDLVRYFVCIPVDRSDARIEGRQSTLQQWEMHVAKWKCWAQERCMSVEFIWWGSSELFDRLSRPEHIGRVFFWFNERYFDEDWFRNRLREAHQAAGPRYTRKIRVDVPIVRELALFGRTVAAFDQIKSLAIDIRRMLQNVRYAFSDDEESSHDFDLEGLSQSIELDDLLRSGEEVLRAFAALEFSPAGKIPLDVIEERVTATRKLASKTSGRLQSVWSAYSLPHERESRSPYSPHPLAHLRGSLFSLEGTLNGTQFQLSHASVTTNSNLMILNGMAGTGKTHLLCDLARRRIEMDAPTVLLMGQHFTILDEPWTQVLQQLDLHETSAEQFVGALEAVAQAENRRALVIIDALNEGVGYEIWPNHLAAFLTRLEQSSWIGVVLAVRSTYEEFIIPEQVRKRAIVVTHEGFAGQEYNAVQAFFSHYGLEFPSAPILQPEFSNPLFLKMICEGLRDRGEERLPKGLHGVTEFFDFYLKSINCRLAESLDYDPKDTLVQDALRGVAQLFADKNTRFLSRREAQRVVNDLLPDRDYSESLYRGLVTEGILLEDMDRRNAVSSEWVTSFTYERFADHIAAAYLIQSNLEVDSPEAAFAMGGGLAYLGKEGVYTRPGLIEALSIQVPERTGQELVRLAPKLLDEPNIGHIFRQSIVWRSLESFTEDTLEVLNELVKYEEDLGETLDALLTIATIENHPFNAELLDENLRRCSMPDRDAWWSMYLHHAWETETKGAVHRFVDWALGVSSDDDLEDPIIDLSATTLAWMLTTSNRFLRDRATKALVSLLTGRLDATARLIERFHVVDDPYVTERVYAVAYGAAMRSHDAAAVGKLASLVYEKIFAAGRPPAQILLRDYARGVIERALFLGSGLQVDKDLIRPPYNSDWPEIPDEKAIRTLMPDWSKGTNDGERLEQARSQIEFSVMYDDFARYVIGTNSGSINWLSLWLEEELWQSPKERTEAWQSKLSKEERRAWEEYEDRNIDQPITITLGIEGERGSSAHFVGLDEKSSRVEIGSLSEADRRELEQAIKKADEESKDRLFSALTIDHRAELKSIFRISSEGQPSFDLSQTQRYVLWRVFDLGWTIKRFGHFDSQFLQDYQRDAAKPERIGKKYQWIAYHEILAHIADHFQYREEFSDEKGDRAYEGPWQEILRDIDPSCTLASTPDGTPWGGHNPSWWGNFEYTTWDEGKVHKDWLTRKDDTPQIDQLLQVTDIQDGTRWLNAEGFFSWQQPHPADVEPNSVDRRNVWFLCTAYFVRAEDAAQFMNWAKSVDFWGRWMPEPPETHNIFCGEYGWSRAFRHLYKPNYGVADWERPKHDCPTSVQPASFVYNAASQGFDCSVEESYSLCLPHHALVTRMGLKWTGMRADFVDRQGKLMAYDPTAHEKGPTALLLREDMLRQYLSEEELALVWTILGEKHVLGKDHHRIFHGSHRISGAYVYESGQLEGSLKHHFEKSRNLAGNQEL